MGLEIDRKSLPINLAIARAIFLPQSHIIAPGLSVKWEEHVSEDGETIALTRGSEDETSVHGSVLMRRDSLIDPSDEIRANPAKHIDDGHFPVV